MRKHKGILLCFCLLEIETVLNAVKYCETIFVTRATSTGRTLI